MSLHPHQKWALKYPATTPARTIPKRVAKKFYLKANRLYARTSDLLIRTNHLPSQAQLNNREIQLQQHFMTERQTSGNGSPLHGNPQQVFTFSPTDEVPSNVIIDDFIELVKKNPVSERDLEVIMIPSVAPGTDNVYQRMVDRSQRRMVAPRTDKVYQRMVDRSHRRMVNSLLGDPSPPLGVDMTTMMRVERRVSALGF